MTSYAAVEPDAVEIRVAACLVEKQRTTPDQYPLTLNSLRLACNQSTNRDPVVEYDEPTIRSALDRLGRRKWTTLASWSTARSVKYKHLLDQALGLDDPQLAVVTDVEGPYTAGQDFSVAFEIRDLTGARVENQGTEPDPEHGRPRLHHRRLQPYRFQGRCFP
jgi:uncharacterized protein YceH (UPF0502 family)